MLAPVRPVSYKRLLMDRMLDLQEVYASINFFSQIVDSHLAGIGLMMFCQ